MDIQLTKTVPLKTFPGAVITIAVWMEEHRAAHQLKAAEAMDRHRDLQAQNEELIEPLEESLGKPGSEIKISELNPSQRAALDKLRRRVQLVEAEIDHAYVEVGLRGLDGVTILGRKANELDVTARRVPPAMYQEILKAVRREAGLEPLEVENLESPSTSGAQVDGKTSDTNALNADATGGLTVVTAEDMRPKP